jgi:hypothetical protein
MGFNKRYINYDNTLSALKLGRLSEYYGKTDAFVFEDSESIEVYELFVEGKTNSEILTILNDKNNGR